MPHKIPSKQKLGSPSTTFRLTKSGAGFTLVETLVAVGVFAILMGLVITNYRRGNDDSILSREAALLMAQLRVAQEQTAAGRVTPYCHPGNSDTPCVGCAEEQTCTQSSPSGGYGVFFSCSTDTTGDNHWPDRDHYFTFGDRVQCQKNCFPFIYDDAAHWDSNVPAFRKIDAASDHLFSSGGLSPGPYGDTIASQNTFDSKVKIIDLQLIESGVNGGKATCVSLSPWIGKQPLPGDAVPAGYPLQATIHFPAPDGRQVVISDNISTKTPTSVIGFTGDQPWKEANIMLALKARPSTDCRVVRVTKDGIISQSTDADCQF
ncbi:MAG: type II secretion system protein [Patescibacteria group bacterium]